MIADSSDDDINMKKLQNHNLNINMNSNTNYRNKNKNNYNENQNNFNNNENIDSSSRDFINTTIGILDVPMTDLSILFSSISNSNGNYGNKINNLKISLKDV